MKISKCLSCGGKLDRIFNSCPICGSAFTCSECGKILSDNESTMCYECSCITFQRRIDALDDVHATLEKTANDLDNLSKRLGQ